jgi:xanthine dehydrogenase accessory factor
MREGTVYEVYERIAHLREQGGEAVLVTVVDKEGSAPAPPGAKMLVYADGSTVGTVGGGAMERLATPKALELLEQKRCLLITYSLGEDGDAFDGEPVNMACGGRASLFYDYLGYQAHIYIFGAGHVGRAIAYHLKGLPYHVTVVDHRQGLLTDLDGADRVLITEYDEALQDEQMPTGAFYVIATPSHAFAYVVLHRIFASGWQPRYVGIVGSRRKASSMLQRLAEELGDKADLDSIYCPVGLDLGGRTPEDIAIAIVAEIQALRHDKTGHRHMRIERHRSEA